MLQSQTTLALITQISYPVTQAYARVLLKLEGALQESNTRFENGCIFENMAHLALLRYFSVLQIDERQY